MTEKGGEGRPGPVILAANAQSCSGLDARRAGVEPRQCILGHSRSPNRSPGPRFQPTVNYKAGGTARCRPGCPRVEAPHAKPVVKPARGVAAEPRGPRAGGRARAPPGMPSESSRGRRAGGGGWGRILFKRRVGNYLFGLPALCPSKSDSEAVAASPVSAARKGSVHCRLRDSHATALCVEFLPQM